MGKTETIHKPEAVYKVEKANKAALSEKTDHVLYICGIVLIVLMAAGYAVIKVFHISYTSYIIPCLVKVFTGYNCPGCGGTRAFKALMRGDLAASIGFHPLVAYGGLIFLWYMVSNTAEKIIWKIGGRKIHIGMRYKNAYVWIGFAIMMANFIIRNILIFMVKN